MITKKIIIVGSGVAGTALASKVLKHSPDCSIVILEAGGKLKLRDFELFQNFLITNKLPYDNQNIYDSCTDLPYPDRDKPGENVFIGDTQIPMNGSRAILYGGSTVHWGGWAFRLKPEDFKLRTNLEAKNIEAPDTLDWPISYNDLEPYYCEAEHFIGVSGNSADTVTPRSQGYPYREFPFTLEDGLFIEAFEKFETPIQYSHLPIARYGVSQTNKSHAPCQTTGLCKYCPFGARFAAANNLDDLVLSGQYPNLSVRQNIIVEEILMNSRSQASGVKYLDKSKNKTLTLEGDIVILATGAIEGPKLLHRSVSEFWKNGIGNDQDLVGRFLISHPYFFFKAILPDNKLMLQPEMGFPTFVSRHFDSIDEQHKGKFILINPPSSPKVNLAREMSSGKTKEQILDSIRENVMIQLQGLIEVFSNRNNRVLNTEKRNRFGMRQTEIHHSKDAKFDERKNEIETIVKQIFEKMGAVNVGEETPISWRADHSACTTRMSMSPEDGVVDSDLKIHGVDNIYVCSNSSFSSLGAVNPTLTLTALSLRLGDHLLNRFRTNPL
jgi:choline dehydrogenase-like flavoprotein